MPTTVFRREDGPSRLSVLHAWLEKNHAVLAWQSSIESGLPLVSYYLVYTVPVLVLTYAGRHGWELFVPSAPHRNSIAASLTAAAEAIGNGCLGPDDRDGVQGAGRLRSPAVTEPTPGEGV